MKKRPKKSPVEAVRCLDELSQGMEKLRALAELMHMGAESQGVVEARTVGRVGGLMEDELVGMRECLLRLSTSLY